ncbi:bidirectional sugar transporter SWEET4-like protein [Tanacetum coccineum]
MCMCLKDHVDAQERKQDKCPLEIPLEFEGDVLDDEVQRNEAIPLSDEEIALDASSEGTLSPGGPRKRIKVALAVLVEVIAFGGLVLFVLTLVHTTQKRSAIVGSISVAANILMYASPLSVMKLVITTKSVEYMPFLLSLFCFSNGLSWFLYALFPFDPFIGVPNGIGALLGVLQLILYATFYKSTKRMLAARKEKAEMSLAVMDSSTMHNDNVANA